MSLQEDARNFTAALKAQNLIPTDFKELEKLLVERFYMLKNGTDRKRLAASMRMNSSEKVRSFVDRIEIATHRLCTSSRLEAIKKENNSAKKSILQNSMDALYETAVIGSDDDDMKTAKIKTAATRELWASEMEEKFNQNFMKYVRQDFKAKLIQFGALAKITFDELVEKRYK